MKSSFIGIYLTLICIVSINVKMCLTSDSRNYFTPTRVRHQQARPRHHRQHYHHQNRHHHKLHGVSRNPDEPEVHDSSGNWNSQQQQNILARTTSSTSSVSSSNSNSRSNNFINFNKEANQKSSYSSSSSYKNPLNRHRNNFDDYNEDAQDNQYHQETEGLPPGDLTRKKMEELGSPTAVEKSFHAYVYNNTYKQALAKLHHERMEIESACKIPKPRVKQLTELGKLFMPRCTILHRCSDDAGCCPVESQTCVAKTYENVTVFFYVTKVGVGGKTNKRTIEPRIFVNHTECHCITKENFIPETAGPGSTDYMEDEPYFIPTCKCPKDFVKITDDRGKCHCNCLANNYACESLRRGYEHFSFADRRCIKKRDCEAPSCEYGFYNIKTGRCPTYKNSVGFF